MGICVKLKVDERLDRENSKLVAKGYDQTLDIDYTETFSLVVKPSTIWVLLNLVQSKGWTGRRLDVNNVFLYGDMQKDVFMTQPEGFKSVDKPHYMYKLKRIFKGSNKLHELASLN